MKTITQTDLIETLATRKGSTIISVITRTDPKWRKFLKPEELGMEGDGKIENPYMASVKKVSHVNGVVNFIYENSVNNQLEREGSSTVFASAPRQWGNRVIREDGTVTPLVEHKGEYYLELKVENVHDSRYMDEDGKEYPSEEVKPWLGKSSSSSRQGTEKEIILRDYKISSIAQIRIGGEIYNVVAG